MYIHFYYVYPYGAPATLRQTPKVIILASVPRIALYLYNTSTSTRYHSSSSSSSSSSCYYPCY